MNFLPSILNGLFVAAVILAVAAAIYILYNIWYTKKNGTEAEAVITRIEEETTYDSDGASTSYDYYVLYTRTDGGASGQEVEAKLTNPGFGRGLEVGKRIKIKYLPEKPNAAVWVK